jgi:hypothetical protein
MDSALALVGGSFVAAAKLLDMTSQRFRNLVHGHATLKARWGKRRGRQAGSLGFMISPYRELHPGLRPLASAAGFQHVLNLRQHILALPRADQIDMRRWLATQELAPRPAEGAGGGVGDGPARAV